MNKAVIFILLLLAFSIGASAREIDPQNIPAELCSMPSVRNYPGGSSLICFNAKASKQLRQAKVSSNFEVTPEEFIAAEKKMKNSFHVSAVDLGLLPDDSTDSFQERYYILKNKKGAVIGYLTSANYVNTEAEFRVWVGIKYNAEGEITYAYLSDW